MRIPSVMQYKCLSLTYFKSCKHIWKIEREDVFQCTDVILGNKVHNLPLNYPASVTARIFDTSVR